jgi:hypothetical protein
MKHGSALADENRASGHQFAAKTLDAESPSG